MGTQSNICFGGFPPYKLNCCKLLHLEQVLAQNISFLCTNHTIMLPLNSYRQTIYSWHTFQRKTYASMTVSRFVANSHYLLTALSHFPPYCCFLEVLKC